MARLVVLNGPPGVGKSTLARRYVDEHPFALNTDPDGIRRMLGGWRDDPARAGLLTRSLALGMARQHLGAGHDVVIPQYLGRVEFLEQAEQVAVDADAQFAEFVLTDNRDEVVRRFNARTAAAADAAHVDAGRIMAELGGDQALFAMCDRLLLVVSARPGARVIHCPDGELERVYADITAGIDG